MPMESDTPFENDPMVERHLPPGQIDPGRARFPCCLVWTPLPLISWFIPFIGHVGICREDGVILDFAGPNFVCVDNFTFGAVARYIQLNKEKCYKWTEHNEMMSWDDTLKKSMQEFQHKNYGLFTCNCHSFVSNNLNQMIYDGHKKWNVVNLAVLMFFKGTWVSKASAARSLLPFVVVSCLGLLLGGLNFLVALVGFTLVLVGWFIIGTYCFKSIIES
ncbi:uncharacterized protein A4U43_C03F20010 [Asparagus officinalis]|uniref:Uncharacterized protein n=1 Tax=Asparagus officinalis TaxID=4686 RepID=A0A5P1FEC0_ASPOF|nr:protein RTE1-HOMOLOG-like [Asparagus officinalis]XP_020257565.1 protein RTE1-HOMOLOG-like [Asparagus officinalis]ONK75737.1 uncharacterized protein A4U43_C03F20010 [Asparagus officinalis]